MGAQFLLVLMQKTVSLANNLNFCLEGYNLTDTLPAKSATGSGCVLPHPVSL